MANTVIGINGMGVLGRRMLLMAIESGMFTVGAVNDPTMPLDTLIYLLKHDTVYGQSKYIISTDNNNNLIIDGKTIAYSNEADNTNLKWSDLEIKVAIDCLGQATSSTDYESWINGYQGVGIKKTVICSNNEKLYTTYRTFVYGENQKEHDGSNVVFSALGDLVASTYVARCLEDTFGIDCLFAEYVTAYTNLNNLQDSFISGYATTPQVGRAGAWNIIPKKNKSAENNLGLIIPNLYGKEISFERRCGVISGSMLDVHAVLNSTYNSENFADYLKTLGESNDLQTIYDSAKLNIKYGKAEYPLCSSDVIGNSYVYMNENYNADMNGAVVNIGAMYDMITLSATNALLVAKYVDENE